MTVVDLKFGYKIFGWGVSLYRLISKYVFLFFPDNEVKAAEGTYLGFVLSSDKTRIRVEDVIELKRAGRHTLRGKPLFDHYRENDYEFIISSTVRNRSLFAGTWEHNKNIHYFGSCMFRSQSSESGQVLEGMYLGPTEGWVVGGSRWYLVKLSDKQFTYNNFFNSKMRHITRNYITKFSDLKIKDDLIDNIVNKHKVYFSQSEPLDFTHEGLFFQIPLNGFNPNFGKISRDLIMYVVGHEDLENKSFLDVGCGSGFYAIYVAKKFSCERVIGLDCDSSVIETAVHNLNKNKSKIKTQSIRFIKDEPKELFKSLKLDDKFDVIVANMPFSNYGSCRKHRDESPELYRNFVANPDVLFSLIMGAKMHLKDNGTMYMSFGDSGYKQALEKYIESAGLVRQTVRTIKGKDDNFYIYSLKHKNQELSPKLQLSSK